MTTQLELKRAIQTLVALNGVNTSSERGLVEVHGDDSIKVTFGEQRGSLADAYKLIDGLERGGLLEGKRAARTDLDAAMYEFNASNPFKIGNNATIATDDQGKIVLTFSSSKPREEFIEGVNQGIERAFREIDRRDAEKTSWTDKVRKDTALDMAKPVFDAKEDVNVVSKYLAKKVEEVFPNSSPQVTYNAKGVMGKPVFDVDLRHKSGESLASFNDFHNGFGKIFDGVCAVSPHMDGGKDDSRIGFSVTGSPARLIGDIKRNDADNLPQSEIKK